MKTIKATLLLLTLSLPLWAANHPDKHGKHDPPPVAVAEGGGTITYLLASGTAIVIALVVRKRIVSRSVQ
jgi:fumarate reductase subunit D